MKIKALLAKEADILKPDDSIKLKCNEVVKEINSLLKKRKTKAVAILGGSIAKGTFLKGDYDCDIFVKFDRAFRGKDISIPLGRILSPLVPFKVHGSRDYYQFAKYGICFEVVPVLEIKSYKEAENVTDVSPLHVLWIESKIKKNSALADEIRLTRAFCKAALIYGAESYINGFSGHVLDILTVNSGSFLSLIREVSKWKGKTIIDPSGHYRRKSVLLELNKSKTEGPLVLVDPVQPNRNAAASVSEENFLNFIMSAKSFLKKPSETFFKKKEISIIELKKEANKKNSRLIIINASPLNGKEDVVGAKLLKSFSYIGNKVLENSFYLKGSGWHWNKKGDALLYFFIDKKNPLPTQIITGPPLMMEDHVRRFKAKYKKTFIEKGRIYSKIERPVKNLKNLLQLILKDNYLLSKTKKLKISIY